MGSWLVEECVCMGRVMVMNEGLEEKATMYMVLWLLWGSVDKGEC